MNTSLIPGQRQSPDAITVRGLNKTYGLPKGGTLTAVDQLDLTIRAGETYALHLRTRCHPAGGRSPHRGSPGPRHGRTPARSRGMSARKL